MILSYCSRKYILRVFVYLDLYNFNAITTYLHSHIAVSTLLTYTIRQRY